MTDKLEARYMKTHFIEYTKESLGYYFYFSEDCNIILVKEGLGIEGG